MVWTPKLRICDDVYMTDHGSKRKQVTIRRISGVLNFDQWHSKYNEKLVVFILMATPWNAYI